MAIVDDSTSVLMQLKGILDPKLELAKLDKKLAEVCRWDGLECAGRGGAAALAGGDGTGWDGMGLCCVLHGSLWPAAGKRVPPLPDSSTLLLHCCTASAL